MTDFLNYKIVTCDDKTGVIQADHDKKQLSVSKDIKLNTTDDGKLCVTFPNFREKSVFEKVFSSKKQSDTDCSLVISDPSYFDHCVQKDGEYKLAGSLITFNGTNKDDKLVLDGNVTGSKINLGDGKDTLDIKSQDYFHQNVVSTGNGNDTVNISGNFKKFCKNQFYLGKGSDKFVVSINPDDDAKTKSEFETKLMKYSKSVFDNEIYAIDGDTNCGDKKGWFESNQFEAKTHSANQLLGNNYSSCIISGADGFQEYQFKPEPKTPITVEPEKEKAKSTSEVSNTNVTKAQTKTNKKLTKEDYEARINAGNLLYMMYGDKNGVEDAWKVTDEYVNSMLK